MPADERAVKLAARLYECRDAARTLFGDSYPEAIQRWRAIVVQVMERYGCSAVLAPLKLAEAAKADGIRLDGKTIMLLSAAAVEESEARP